MTIHARCHADLSASLPFLQPALAGPASGIASCIGVFFGGLFTTDWSLLCDFARQATAVRWRWRPVQHCVMNGRLLGVAHCAATDAVH